MEPLSIALRNFAFEELNMKKQTRILVVSAHAADYVWRAGGTIAHYVSQGAWVKVLLLSLGVRGESNDLWKQGYEEQEVHDIRLKETMQAAKELGVQQIECLDCSDYPIQMTEALQERLVREIRTARPDIILSHDRFDVLNPDHNSVSELVFRCSVMSNSSGVRMEGLPATKQMAIFGFEPHQTELSHFEPGCLIDITAEYDKKIKAMQCFQAQKHLIQYYTDRAFMRGNHARRISGNQSIQYAESFSCFFPYVSTEFVTMD